MPRSSPSRAEGRDDRENRGYRDLLSRRRTGRDLKIASVGFNVDGVHNGVSEGNFRTGKGIGKGSTVNDVLEAYGQPVEILGQQPAGALKRKVAPDDDPSVRRCISTPAATAA